MRNDEKKKLSREIGTWFINNKFGLREELAKKHKVEDFDHDEHMVMFTIDGKKYCNPTDESPAAAFYTEYIAEMDAWVKSFDDFMASKGWKLDDIDEYYRMYENDQGIICTIPYDCDADDVTFD